YGIPIPLGGRQRLEHDGCGTFPAYIAVGPRTEGLASRGGRQEPPIVKCVEQVVSEQEVHTTHERNVAVAGLEAPDSSMQRRQGTRARGVHGFTRPVQVEQEGHAVGEDSVRTSCGCMGLAVAAGMRHEAVIVERRYTDE